jgi:hypothetical protein
MFVCSSPYLRDTLSPLPTAEDGPCDAAGVLALEEKGFALAILEAEDLAVRADEDLALFMVLACCTCFFIPIQSAV